MEPWCATLLFPFRAILILCKSHSLSFKTNSSLESKQNQSKLGQANIISKLTFSWINPLLRLGYSKPLVLEDIPTLLREDEAQVAYAKFSRKWDFLRRDVNLGNKKNLLLRALFKVYWREMIFLGVSAIFRTACVVVSPLLLFAFVQYSNDDRKKKSKGLLLVGLLTIIKLIESFSQRHWFFNSRRSGIRMRSSLIMAIHEKLLKLSSIARRRHSTGEIVNYIAVDAYIMAESLYWFHMEWSLLVQFILSIGILFKVVGLSALPAIVPILFLGFLNVPFAKMHNRCQSRYKVAQDKRLRTTKEVLTNMKIIKLESWEERFKNVIDLLRENEYKCLAESQIKRSSTTVMHLISPVIVSTVVFAGCLLIKSASFNAETIFTVLATIRSMSEPMRWIPEALTMLIQVNGSLNHLNDFLLDDEHNNEESNISLKNLEQNSDNCVEIVGGNFSWEPESAVRALTDINLEVKMGQKIAVCGPVGAGKSALLSAILGEVPKISGSISVSGTIAYVSQTPWIQSGTIRDNILFGKPMDKNKYETVVKSCVLHKDIDSFNHGDITEIGQRGLILSGEQKQRIQLARAVYNDADIYLLDDPLSAVDAQTALTLFNDCLMTALKYKTVILVTHHVGFLTEADKILVLEGGEVTQSGSYLELLIPGTAFEQLVNAHETAVKELVTSDDGNKDETWNIHESCSAEEDNEKNNSDDNFPASQLTKEEEREIGNVGWKPILDYLNVAKGTLPFTLSTLSYVAFGALQAGSSYWLAIAIRVPNVTSAILVGVYAGISTFSMPVVFFRSLFSAYFGLKASKAFFSSINNSVFKAPMLFFDSTTVRRILTRVSSDMSTLDLDLPTAISLPVAAAIDVFIIIAVMASVTWPVLIVAIPTVILAKYVHGYYLSSARELMRMNGTTKAPILNFATETLEGVVSIRAFKMTEFFFRDNLKLVDTDAKLFFHTIAATEWLILRIEALQNLIILTAALLIVLLPGKHLPGFVGLSLSYALTLSSIPVIMAYSYRNLSNNIVSVERIRQFMNIPPEPPAIIEEMRPPASWPSRGRIELENLKVRYGPNSPIVLRGITCTFKEGTRVGVVGRTGSGKTTLISALFRLVEPESGRILIDELDICSIGLKDLRTKLSIIPQEPTLFRGSVRTNLDPLGVYSDKEIWEALEICQLKATIRNLPMLLDSSVSDEDENWSVGQRQLFCLGRILLRGNKILVLDEATASTDSATDAILQRVIKEEFPGCTVITIAHRVPTITDSDMVMVLFYGELIEYDAPSKLMEKNSAFSKLLAEYKSNYRRNSMAVCD